MIEIKQKKPKRSYTGIQWRTNASNKKRLAVDFDCRCAYCDDHHVYSGGYRAYHVEHFAPKEKFPDLKYAYDNLSYACPYCNGSKSDTWVSEDSNINVIGDEGFLDPCEDEYYDNLKRSESGEIVAITPLGKYIYNELQLYLKRHALIYNMDRLREKQEEVKNEIIVRKECGKNTDKLERVYEKLSASFCDYFQIFSETNELALSTKVRKMY